MCGTDLKNSIFTLVPKLDHCDMTSMYFTIVDKKDKLVIGSLITTATKKKIDLVFTALGENWPCKDLKDVDAWVRKIKEMDSFKAQHQEYYHEQLGEGVREVEALEELGVVRGKSFLTGKMVESLTWNPEQL